MATPIHGSPNPQIQGILPQDTNATVDELTLKKIETIYGTEVASNFKLINDELKNPEPDLHYVRLLARELVGEPKQFIDRKIQEKTTPVRAESKPVGKTQIRSAEDITKNCINIIATAFKTLESQRSDIKPIDYAKTRRELVRMLNDTINDANVMGITARVVFTEDGLFQVFAENSRLSSEFIEEKCIDPNGREIKFARLSNPQTEKDVLNLIMHQMKEEPDKVGTSHFGLTHLVIGKSPETNEAFKAFKGCTIQFIEPSLTAYKKGKVIFIPCPPNCGVGEQIHLKIELVQVDSPKQAVEHYRLDQHLSISCSSKGQILTDYAANLIIRDQLRSNGHSSKIADTVFSKLFSRHSVGATLAKGRQLLNPSLPIRLQLACRSALENLRAAFHHTSKKFTIKKVNP